MTKHTPGPWRYWNREIIGNGPKADTICKIDNYDANAHLIVAAPDEHKALYFLGGGDVYLETFGRLCFCSGCRIGERGPINKKIHSSSCDATWEAYAKAEG